MKGKKTDSKTKAKIIKEKVGDVDKSAQDISNTINVPERTVSRIIKEDLAKVGGQSEVIQKIIDNDKEFIELASTMGANKLKKLILTTSEGETLDIHELDKIVTMAEKVFKRFTLLQGDVTDENGGLKEGAIDIKDAGY